MGIFPDCDGALRTTHGLLKKKRARAVFTTRARHRLVGRWPEGPVRAGTWKPANQSDRQAKQPSGPCPHTRAGEVGSEAKNHVRILYQATGLHGNRPFPTKTLGSRHAALRTES